MTIKGKFIRDEYGRLYSHLPGEDPVEEVWAREERVHRLENQVETLQRQINKDWVEEELKAIKSQSSERICKWCKWADFIGRDDEEIICHYYPQEVAHTLDWWCSFWCDK